jgi:hypothetical protein
MITRNRTKHAAAEAAAQPAVQADEATQPDEETPDATEGPLGDLTAPDDIAAVAARMRAQAAAHRDGVTRNRAEGEALMAAARAEAARLIGEAEAKSRELGAGTGAREREAAALETRARALDNAVTTQTAAVAAAEFTLGLLAEREQLAGQITDLGARIDQLSADRREADSQLGNARQEGDVDAIGALLARIAGIDDLASALTAERTAAQDRTRVIGDGDQSQPGELSKAHRTATSRHATVRKIFNDVWPDRPEAVLDAAKAELVAVIEANCERMAEEARAEPATRTTVFRYRGARHAVDSHTGKTIIVLGDRDVEVLAHVLPEMIQAAHGAPGKPPPPLELLDLANEISSAARSTAQFRAAVPQRFRGEPVLPRSEEPAWTVAEVAEASGLSTGYVRRVIRRRDLKASQDRLGAAYHVSPGDLAAWQLRRRKKRPGKAA